MNRPFSACHTLLIAAAAAILFPGCAAMKATQQPGKRDLAVLNEGVSRSRVLAELGAPVWSEERDGVTTDVFAFKQGYSKGVKAGRALVHGAADVATFGLWEVVGIPVESLADGRDVKLEIIYDRQRMVQSVNVLDGEDVVRPKPMFAGFRKQKSAVESSAVATDEQEYEGHAGRGSHWRADAPIKSTRE